MSVNKVYVSYAWKVEEQNRIVDKLEEACQQRGGIALQRDINNISYGGSIRAYMDELAAGEYVVLVLSKPYFESSYCMYELREIYKNKNKDFRKRVFPIVVKGTRFNDPIERIPYIKHWEQKKQALKVSLNEIDRENIRNLNDALDDYADFRRLMDDLLGILSDMNALTEDIHINSNFADLLEKISPNTDSPRSGGQRCQLKFEANIRNELCKALKKRHTKALSDALYDEVGKTQDDPLAEVVGEWWQENEHLQKVRQFREMVEACLEELSEHENLSPRHPFCLQSRQIMGWLVLFSVSQDWLNQHYNPDNPFHKIPLQYVAGIEILTASLADMPVSLSKPAQGSGVVGERLVALEKQALKTDETWSLKIPESGWLPEPAVEQTGIVAWKMEFKESKKQLSPTDWNMLSTVLRGKKKYLAVDGTKEKDHPLLDDRICRLLQQKLKGVNVVRFGLLEVEGCANPLIVDEGDLLGEIWLFLDMMEKYENS